MRDYYQVLGMPRNASQGDIKQAYRKLARQYHPDVNPDKADGEERFKEINGAYEVLSNPENRRRYDKYGDNWKHADQIEEAQAVRGRGLFNRGVDLGEVFGFADSPAEDLFERFFSGVSRGRRRSAIRFGVDLTLAEALNGATRYVELPGDGLGPPRRLEVKVPPGVDNGSQVRIPVSGDGAQEIYLEVRVRPDPRFQRKGHDIYTEVQVPLLDAVLGAEMMVPTPQGKVALKLPPETQNGQTFRLTGQGMPVLRGNGARGQLYVTVKVALPTQLTERERELFRKLEELRAHGR